MASRYLFRQMEPADLAELLGQERRRGIYLFNGRAIRVYERAGFRRGEVYTHETSGGEHEFLSMRREA